MTRRRPDLSKANPMSQKLVCATCCNSGKVPADQMHTGRVTAGIRNQTSLRNLAGIELWNAVNGFREPLSVGRGQLVPGGEGFGIAKAERSAQIDDAEAGLEQIRRQFRGNLVRSRKKRGASVA